MYAILANFSGDDLTDITCDLAIMSVKSSVFPLFTGTFYLSQYYFRAFDDKLIPDVCDVIIDELKGCKSDSLKYKISLVCGFFYKMYKQIVETIQVHMYDMLTYQYIKQNSF